SAPLAFMAGKVYFAKLWWSDGVQNFRDAIRLDGDYRNDPELIKIAVRGFNTTPDVDDRLASFILDDLGEVARPLLEETAQKNASGSIRARDSTLLRHLRASGTRPR